MLIHYLVLDNGDGSSRVEFFRTFEEAEARELKEEEEYDQYCDPGPESFDLEEELGIVGHYHRTKTGRSGPYGGVEE